jgi:hypothetical protein
MKTLVLILGIVYLLVGAGFMCLSKLQGEGWNWKLLYKWPLIISGKSSY